MTGAASPAPRKRIPYWAAPVLAFLPVWAYLFQGTLAPPPAQEVGPLAVGAQIYASQCSGCHGGDGRGKGSVPALAEVVAHWPDGRDQMAWVRLGSAGWPGATLGTSDRPVTTGMTAFASLSEAELAAVVLYERVTHGGLDVESGDALLLVALAEGATTLAESGPGPLSADLGLTAEQLTGRP